MKKLTSEQRDAIFEAWEKSVVETDDGVLVKFLVENTEEKPTKVNVPEWNKLVAPLKTAQHPCPKCEGLHREDVTCDSVHFFGCQCPNCGSTE